MKYLLEGFHHVLFNIHNKLHGFLEKVSAGNKIKVRFEILIIESFDVFAFFQTRKNNICILSQNQKLLCCTAQDLLGLF